MRTVLPALLFAASLLLAGCAAPSSNSATPSAPATPLPDGRDLSEDPLDVMSLPQP
jgi:uncharacterized lipoprotein YajG